MRKIVIENTIYSLFLYLLLERDWKESIYILDHRLYKQLESVSILRKKYSLQERFISEGAIPFYIEKLKLLFVYLRNNLFLGEFKTYGNEKLFYFLPKLGEAFILEDGLETYTRFLHEKNAKKTVCHRFRKFLKLEQCHALVEEKVKKYYLTGVAEIPENISRKSEVIDLKELWEKKTVSEQDELLSIFALNRADIEQLKGKTHILYTQPLSEDKFLSEEEKISLYSQIVAKYKGKDLVIKKHPREQTNYEKYFPNISIMNTIAPSELLTLLGVKFQKAITLFSTAALSDKEIEVDFYGTEVHQKLFNYFGTMDPIMKRNRFLEEDTYE